MGARAQPLSATSSQGAQSDFERLVMDREPSTSDVVSALRHLARTRASFVFTWSALADHRSDERSTQRARSKSRRAGRA